MKKLVLSLFALVLTATLFTNCQKETTTLKPTTETCESESMATTSKAASQMLVGTWVWTKTEGGRLAPSGPYETAASTGMVRKLIITDDGQVTCTENGKQLYTTTFTLEGSDSQIFATQTPFETLVFVNDYFSGLVQVCDAHLRTGKSYVDGFDYYYDKE